MVAPRRWSCAEEERVVALVARCAGSRRHLEQVHSHIVATGGQHNNYVTAKLVRAFADLGLIRQARKVFETVREPNAFIWNALIRGYANHSASDDDCCAEALRLYARMHRSGSASPPLAFTLSSVLKSCAKFLALEVGKQIHAHVFKYGFRCDVRVQTTLIDLYGRCQYAADARRVFHGIGSAEGMGDLQLCNTMITACCLSGDIESARHLFDEMPHRNTYTWIEMISGYAATKKMDCARELFDKLPLSHDVVDMVVVCTAMITGFTKCGDMMAARTLFDEMPTRDFVVWNAMISGYTNLGLLDQAIDLFNLMLDVSMTTKVVRPNRVTIAIIASACAQSGSAELATRIDDYVQGCRGELLNSYTVAALVDMHAKCGDLRTAYSMFKTWKQKDLVCYSSMIAAFGIHGRGSDAMQVFGELINAGLRPDGICFVSVLAACSHAGLVEEGRRCFASMRHDYGISPTVEHYMCMVDLLGRAGLIEEAHKMINEDMLPEMQSHAGIWGALLSSCRTPCNVKVAEEAAGHLMELEPDNAGNYVLLSNIYALAQQWGDVARVRALMRGRGMQKPPGWSWLEVGGRLRKFLTGEADDPQVVSMMELLGWELSDERHLSSLANKLERDPCMSCF
ncbi:hypothetical protein Taro_024158 [Colocasia esculenta]|uniref:Pentatricopeptide repeat-containing protein n=1 Tax=Colocasia esculenta TaxID=4460 RepID=A0A843VDN1_COLES|nr:hypothetical protein [Colocasia esculenta]